jgi:hypothetical protein
MTDRFHVIPKDDIVQHDTSTEDCVCGIRVEPVTGTDGSMSWLLIHAALDGRDMEGDVLERGRNYLAEGEE